VGPVILFAILSHHTPAITSCYDTSRVNMTC